MILLSRGFKTGILGRAAAESQLQPCPVWRIFLMTRFSEWKKRAIINFLKGDRAVQIREMWTTPSNSLMDSIFHSQAEGVWIRSEAFWQELWEMMNIRVGSERRLLAIVTLPFGTAWVEAGPVSVQHLHISTHSVDLFRNHSWHLSAKLNQGYDVSAVLRRQINYLPWDMVS